MKLIWSSRLVHSIEIRHTIWKTAPEMCQETNRKLMVTEYLGVPFSMARVPTPPDFDGPQFLQPN